MGPVSCFIECYLSHQSHPLVCIILKLNFIPNSSFGKSHSLPNYMTYILLFSCAYLKHDNEGSFQMSTYSTDFVSVYFLYCSYIFVPEIPIFLYIWSPKLLDALMLCKVHVKHMKPTFYSNIATIQITITVELIKSQITKPHGTWLGHVKPM